MAPLLSVGLPVSHDCADLRCALLRLGPDARWCSVEWPEAGKRRAIWAEAVAKVPLPPPEKACWGPQAVGSNELAHLSLAIVEPRKHEWMGGVLRNASHVYGGTGASLYIFHGNLNKEWLQDVLQECGITGAILKPLGHDNLTIDLYSELWCSAEFYDNFPTSHVLVFQTDVLMRRRVPAFFFDFQYVGAPWLWHPQVLQHGKSTSVVNYGAGDIVVWNGYGGMQLVGNGGYSLRNVAEMKRILTEHDYKAEKGWANLSATGGNSSQRSPVQEDAFISSKCDCEGLPANHEAAEFSVEGIWHPDPTGMHNPLRPCSRPPPQAILEGNTTAPWASDCPECPIYEDRYFSADMLAGLLECVVDPELPSNAHKYGRHQTSDLMAPSWREMQAAAVPVPFQIPGDTTAATGQTILIYKYEKAQRI